MAAANIPVRSKGQTTCFHHKGRQLELYCEKCQELTCVTCVATIHKGHLLCELSEITRIRKQDIIDFVDRIEQKELVEIGKYINSTNTLFNENDLTFKNLSKQVWTQTQRLKQDLDELTAETLSLYQKMNKENNDLIQKYKQELEMYEAQLIQQMEECKKVLQHGSPIEVYDTECEIDFRLHLPVKPVLGTISFSRNKNPRNHLELALGTFDDSGQMSTLRRKYRSVSLSHGQEQSSTHQQSSGTMKKEVARIKLLTETKVLEEWKSPCDIISICPITDKAWTKSSDTLSLLDRKGRLIKEVRHKAYITDISLSPRTHRLWACDGGNNILELVSGQLSVQFRTKDQPECICVTSDNHIIIGMPKHVTKYTTQGQIVLTTKVTETATSLVCSPHKITECLFTNNVAVIDASDIDDGGDGNAHVVVMNSDFQELFVYRGDIPSRYKELPQVGDGPFNPLGIVYDSQGNIIIAGNDKILLLSADGKVLSILHTDTVGLWDIGVSRQDVLWTVNINNNVKLLQNYE